MNIDSRIQKLWNLGHFFNPSVINGRNVTIDSLHLLSFNDKVVQEALLSLQDIGYLVLKNLGRNRGADGELDKFTKLLFEVPRCGHPDYELNQAIGTGSWPMPCQKDGVKIYYDKSRMPSVLVSRWPTIQSEMFAAYAEIGCKLIEVQSKAESNIYVSWTTFFGSTIGLSSFNSQNCSDSASQQLGINYTDLMFELHTHETGHNMNLGHTVGGIMSPYIIKVDPHKWNKNDPSYSTLVKYFGGEPVGPVIPITKLTVLPSNKIIESLTVDFNKFEVLVKNGNIIDQYVLINNKII